MGGQQIKTLSTIALIALLVGASVYLIDRPCGSAYLIPCFGSIFFKEANLFGSVGDSLPEFVHIYVFILLTAVCLQPSKNQLIIVCIVWLLTELMFEVLQLDSISLWLITIVGERFNGIPVLENLTVYLSHGVFDKFDVCAIAVGAVFAYLTVSYVMKKATGEML